MGLYGNWDFKDIVPMDVDTECFHLKEWNEMTLDELKENWKVMKRLLQFRHYDWELHLSNVNLTNELFDRIDNYETNWMKLP